MKPTSTKQTKIYVVLFAEPLREVLNNLLLYSLCIRLQNKFSLGFTASVEWTGNMVTFLDAIFKLLVFQKMGQEQRFLYPSSFRNLTVDSEIFHGLEKGQ